MFCIVTITSPTDYRQLFADITSFVGKAASLTRVGLIPNIKQLRNFSIDILGKMICYNQHFPYYFAMFNARFLHRCF